MKTQNTLLITGATGQLGRLVLAELLKMTDLPLIATTRHPEKLSDFAQQGVIVRQADFNQPETLAEAFAGATRMLLISTDAFGAERINAHRHAIEAAVEAGVQHIVYTSWPNPEQSVALLAPDHAATEKMLRESGVSYTILRNQLYSEMLLRYVLMALKTGVLAGTTGNQKAAYVTRLDCACAAAAALCADTTDSQILDVTGPKTYAYSEVAQMVSDLTGQTIQVQELSEQAYQQLLQKSGIPAFYAGVVSSIGQAIHQGELNFVSATVQDLTGKKPTEIRDFLADHLSMAAQI